MKNKVLQICIAGAVLSASSLAFGIGYNNENNSNNNNNNNNDNNDNNSNNEGITDAQMLTYSIISGAAVSIAGQPALHDHETKNVGGQIAAQAAVTIGANANVNDIYAGAAVTTGAGSHVGRINAGAAVTIGASGAYSDVDAGAAITYGAASYVDSSTEAPLPGKSRGESAGITNFAIKKISDKFEGQFDSNAVAADISGMWGSDNDPVIAKFSAINTPAGTTVTITGDVTFVSTGAVTLGAGTRIALEPGASVKWIIGGALNLGAGTKFVGEAYVQGAVNGATSEVCGNLYALGAVSVASAGGSACQTEAEKHFISYANEVTELERSLVAAECRAMFSNANATEEEHEAAWHDVEVADHALLDLNMSHAWQDSQRDKHDILFKQSSQVDENTCMSSD